jgi:hypothetical protein
MLAYIVKRKVLTAPSSVVIGERRFDLRDSARHNWGSGVLRVPVFGRQKLHSQQRWRIVSCRIVLQVLGYGGVE